MSVPCNTIEIKSPATALTAPGYGRTGLESDMPDRTCKVPVKMYGTGGQMTFALVDRVDYPRVCERSWGVQPGIGYAYRKDIAYREYDGKGYYVTVTMHRFLAGAMDEQEQVDHINGDRLDNRQSNLRICTLSENRRNRSVQKAFGGKPVLSKYKGVSATPSSKSNPWRAYITVRGKLRHIGVFANEEDAARAYNKAALELHGEFARLNEIQCDSA